jgi:hypothetical protein
MTPDVLPAVTPDWSALVSLPLRVSVSQTILILVFALVVVFWAIMTVIFIYHWRRFPYGKVFLGRIEWLYLGVSAVLILLALGGIVAI